MTLSTMKLTPARTLASLAAAGTLLAAPATGLAKMRHDANKDKRANSCAKARDVAFSVAGTLMNVSADPATVTLRLTSANRHARRSGEIVDQNLTKKGVQAKGFVYTVPATDAYKLRLHGYDGSDTPSPGDRVKVTGRVALTKAHCAAPGTSVADRYGAVDVRRVTIGDRDPD